MEQKTKRLNGYNLLRKNGFKRVDKDPGKCEVYESKDQRVILSKMHIDGEYEWRIFSEKLEPTIDELGMKHYDTCSLNWKELLCFATRMKELADKETNKKNA